MTLPVARSARRPAPFALWSLALLLLTALAPPRLQAQDTPDTVRMRVYHEGALKAAAEDAFLCPGDVPVGSQPLTIDFEVTTTSPDPVQYTATFSFSNQTLDAAVTSDTHGNPDPVVNGGTTTYTVEGLLSNTMPFRVNVVTTATAVGPATTDWEVRRAGVIRQEEHCAFDVIEGGGGGPEADLALAVSGIQGSLSFDIDTKTATLPLGEAAVICIQVVNHGPDEATEVVITGGMDPTRFEIQDVTLDPPLGTCSFDPLGGFFSCAGLTLPAGDSVKVNLTGVGVAETEGEGFSASTGHPNESDFSNNDDFVTMAIEPVGHDGSIEGTVFLDLDGDGILNADLMDVGLEEQLVFLDLNYNGQYDVDTDSSTTSDADGMYHFENLPQVVLEVGIVTLEGWEFTIPADGFQIVNLNEDPEQEDVNFGTRPRAGAILGAKWEDRDADGQIDEGEPRLEGWRIYLDLNNNGMLDDGEPSDSTNGAGLYAIGDLEPGTFVVREVQQDGFAQTFPKDPDHHTVTLTQGEYVGGIRFGNRPVGSIHGVAYEDLNANGQRDDGERGLDGLTISLRDRETGMLVAETMTMAMGDTLHGVYWLDDVPPGIYDLFERKPTGFEITEPPESQGPFGPFNAHLIVLSEGERRDSVNFGNAPTPDLAIDKMLHVIGDAFFYVLTVTTTGESPNTVVTDSLAANLELLSFTTTQGTCTFTETDRKLICDLGTVLRDVPAEIKLQVRVVEGALRNARNKATVTGFFTDSFPLNNEIEIGSILIKVIEIDKEASAQEIRIGESITYTITVKNTSAASIRDIVVTDTLSEKVEFVSVTSSDESVTCRFEESSRAVICTTDRLVPVLFPNVDETVIHIEVVAVRAGGCPNIATIEAGRRLDEPNTVEVQADTVQVTIKEDDATPTELEAALPDAFALYDNYPNPFNPETVIRFDVPHRARVRLQVFNVLGQIIITLVDKEQAAGSYRTVFDARGLPSGSYFYRLEAGAFSETRSMILLK